jgi:hypothetical protein
MRKNKNSDENFTSLLSAIERQAVAPDPELLKQLRERSAQEFTTRASNLSANPPKSIRVAAMRSMIMKSPWTRLAAAAALVIACVIGLSLWRTTGSGIALADVLARVERVEKVKAYGFKWTMKVSNDNPNNPYNYEGHNTDLISQEYGWKHTYEERDPNGGQRAFQETYFLPQKNTRIEIIPGQKKYSRIELDDAYVQRQQKHDLESRDPLLYLRDILKYRYESLGRSTIDGVEVAGFRSTDPNRLEGKWNPHFEVKLWVDVKTLLPVRYEYDHFGQMGNKKDHTRLVIYDYQWDVPVNAADFEPPVPDGYTSWEIKLPPNNEETAIQGLKQCVELFGTYPERTTDIYQRVKMVLSGNRNGSLPAGRLQEQTKGLTEDEVKNKLLIPIRGLERFTCRIEWDGKDPAYYGDRVTPKDPYRILMRWKVSDSEYRVIFGDLHAETVSGKKLAELEAALPKVEGGFESGVLHPWRTYGNVTAQVVTELAGATVPENVIEGKYCLFLDVAPGIANFWDAGLQSPGVAFQKGKKYTLSAFLKSKKGPMQVYFKPELATDPWTGYGEEMMTITEKWAEYSVTTPVFEADVRPANLTFHIGSAVGGLWVDGVRLYEGDYVPPPAEQ